MSVRSARVLSYNPALGVRPQGFPASLRLKQRREFLRVQRGGRKHHLRHFMVFASARPAPIDAALSEDEREALATRLGITVTRKVGDAVTRNRIKRLVREVFRQHRGRLPSGLDVVWVAKQQAAGASFADVLADFEAIVRRFETLGRGELSAKQPERGQRRGKPAAAKR